MELDDALAHATALEETLTLFWRYLDNDMHLSHFAETLLHPAKCHTDWQPRVSAEDVDFPLLPTSKNSTKGYPASCCSLGISTTRFLARTGCYPMMSYT